MPAQAPSRRASIHQERRVETLSAHGAAPIRRREVCSAQLFHPCSSSLFPRYRYGGGTLLAPQRDLSLPEVSSNGFRKRRPQDAFMWLCRLPFLSSQHLLRYIATEIETPSAIGAAGKHDREALYRRPSLLHHERAAAGKRSAHAPDELFQTLVGGRRPSEQSSSKGLADKNLVQS